MAETPARKAPQVHEARVLRTERITPHMVRLVLGGEGLASFGTDGFTDHYVKVVFPVPGVTYPEPFDMTRIREELLATSGPATARTRCVRGTRSTASW